MASTEGGVRVRAAQARALPGVVNYFDSDIEPQPPIEGEPMLVTLGSVTAVPRSGVSYVGIGWSTVESEIANINVLDGQFSRLAVGLGKALGAATVTVTLRVNWQDTALSLTMTGTQQGAYVDGVVNAAAGDIIDCEVVCNGVANPGVVVSPSLVFTPAAMSAAAAPTPAVMLIGAYNIPASTNGYFGPTSEFVPQGGYTDDVGGPLPAGKLLEVHWKLGQIGPAAINGWVWLYIIKDGQRVAGWATAPGPGSEVFRTIKGELDWPENATLAVEVQNYDNSVAFSVSGALVFEAAPLLPPATLDVPRGPPEASRE